ncbi:hypothetical protein Lal_00032885 [Lupinus albus]|nr:hypothetical protein Lal_00032885 [Lupinus albus]
MEAVKHPHGRMFFLYGYGGTGKTHMWRTLTFALRSQKHIVLIVASSGIAFLLLPGGRTTHSKFKILVSTFDNSVCNIHQGSELADLLKQTKLIIWNEAPMAHKFYVEALDKSLGDIMGTTANNPSFFGGKVFGDKYYRLFREVVVQILYMQQSMHHIFGINVQFSLLQRICVYDNATDITQFSKWILKIGDGNLFEPNDGCVEVDIPEELLILDYDNPIDVIVSSPYPNLQD